MLIDSHCHILSSEYTDVNAVLKETFESDVDKIIINGYDLKSSIEAVSIAKKNKNVYAAVGIGPENIDGVDNNTIIQLEKLLSEDKVIAIGEIGIDYYWTKNNRTQQIEIFKSMLNLSKKYNLPVIVHSRDSMQDVYDILTKYKVTGIIHCFSGSVEMAQRFVKLGFLIGIGGVITFKNSKKLKEVVSEIPIESISLETDSPYLTPEPYRGKQNTPMLIKYIADEISRLKNMSCDQVIFITGCNVAAKFDL